MSDFYLPEDYGQVAMYLKQATISRQCIITWGIKLVDGAAWDITARNLYRDDVVAALKPIWDNTVTITRLRVVYSVTGGATLRLYDAAPNVVGTHSGPVSYAPPNVAALARKTTSFAGRQNRGRMYLPFVNEGTIDIAGQLTALEVSGINAALNAFMVKHVGGANEVESVTISHVPTVSDPTPLPTTVDDIICEGIVATQRRRLVR